MEEWHQFRIADATEVDLASYSTEATFSKPDKDEIDKRLQKDTERISELQYKLYAEDKRALLIILQGMDGAGKDSAIRHILTGVNPQGVEVSSFKRPSETELQHDFFWRHYQKLPGKGKIGIFNRSYYENVLIARVHPEIVLNERLPEVRSVSDITEDFWEARYRQINNFERTQIENGTTVLKFFLHLSKKEQRKRFLKRLDEREKNWKFSSADLKEREFWDEYCQAYAIMLSKTSTAPAPWFVIPADNKWFAHLAMGTVILETLKKMNPSLPEVSAEEEHCLQEARLKLKDKEA